MKKPKISIIIVNFNTKEMTLDCLDSLTKYSPKVPYEIIVFDNASKDGSTAALEKNKNIKLIKNKENIGFARGNNEASQEAHGEYILLLNSDTKLTEDAITPLVEFMDKNEEYAVISAKLLNKNGTVQPTGGFFPTIPRALAWMSFADDLPLISSFFQSFHPKAAFYNKARDLDWVTGAFFLIRSKVWKDLKGFDKDYFMYVEEMDLCYRIYQMGYKVRFDPKVSLIHYGGASSSSSFPIINEFRGLKIFYKKHMSVLAQSVFGLLLKLGTFLRVILHTLLGHTKLAKAYQEALHV